MEEILNCIQLYLPLVQLVTLIVIIVYTIITNGLRKGQIKILEQTIESNEPNVIVSFREGKKYFHILLEIENVGKKAAYVINFNVNPSFNFNNDLYNKVLNESKILTKGLPILKGGEKIQIHAGSTIKFYNDYHSNKLQSKYTFSISYKDMEGKIYTRQCVDSIDKFFTRIHSEFKSQKTLVLEAINKTLQEKL